MQTRFARPKTLTAASVVVLIVAIHEGACTYDAARLHPSSAPDAAGVVPVGSGGTGPLLGPGSGGVAPASMPSPAGGSSGDTTTFPATVDAGNGIGGSGWDVAPGASGGTAGSPTSAQASGGALPSATGGAVGSHGGAINLPANGGSPSSTTARSTGGAAGSGSTGTADASGTGGATGTGGTRGNEKGGDAGKGGKDKDASASGAGGVAVVDAGDQGPSCANPPTNYRQPCGSCGGSIGCDGKCTIATPPSYGSACLALSCGCGLDILGTIDCSGQCRCGC